MENREFLPVECQEALLRCFCRWQLQMVWLFSFIVGELFQPFRAVTYEGEPILQADTNFSQGE